MSKINSFSSPSSNTKLTFPNETKGSNGKEQIDVRDPFITARQLDKTDSKRMGEYRIAIKSPVVTQSNKDHDEYDTLNALNVATNEIVDSVIQNLRTNPEKSPQFRISDDRLKEALILVSADGMLPDLSSDSESLKIMGQRVASRLEKGGIAVLKTYTSVPMNKGSVSHDIIQMVTSARGGIAISELPEKCKEIIDKGLMCKNGREGSEYVQKYYRAIKEYSVSNQTNQPSLELQESFFQGMIKLSAHAYFLNTESAKTKKINRIFGRGEKLESLIKEISQNRDVLSNKPPSVIGSLSMGFINKAFLITDDIDLIFGKYMGLEFTSGYELRSDLNMHYSKVDKLSSDGLSKSDPTGEQEIKLDGKIKLQYKHIKRIQGEIESNDKARSENKRTLDDVFDLCCGELDTKLNEHLEMLRKKSSFFGSGSGKKKPKFTQ